jgi:hypothetical protein
MANCLSFLRKESRIKTGSCFFLDFKINTICVLIILLFYDFEEAKQDTMTENKHIILFLFDDSTERQSDTSDGV